MTESIPSYLPTYLELESLHASIEKAARQVQGGLLLDVGCGRRPYASLFSSVTRYMGIDLPRCDEVQWCPDVWASGLQLPFTSRVFDTVLCTQVIEHVQRPRQLVREAYRVLKPGGAFVLTAPQTWGLHEEPWDYYRFTKYGLVHILEAANFVVQWVDARGGAFRMIGQTLLNLFYIRNKVYKLTWWLKSATRFLNAVFMYLDQRWHWDKDTLGYTVLATRPENSVVQCANAPQEPAILPCGVDA